MKCILIKSRLIGIVASVAATMVIFGCSDDSGLPTRYKVSGKVTHNGEPVPKATIVFEPVNPPLPEGRVANGLIENGSYTLTTATPDDGALPGEYKVMVLATTIDTTELAKEHGGLLHQGDNAHQKAAKAAKNPLPEKYAQTSNTPLKATVDAKNSNYFEFDLKDD